jgi:hypothetical protein
MMKIKPSAEKNIRLFVVNVPLRVYKREEGVAIIMALIMLLVMSVLATTVSFNSNNDFRAMSNYKQGQEAFLAAENCVWEARHNFEIIGIEYMYLLEQNKDTALLSELSSKYIVLNSELDNGAKCRSGPRFHDSETDGPGQIIEVPPPTKTVQRPLKNTSMTTSASGGAGLFPSSFVVTGKDQRDKDIDDVKGTINTGTEIAAGYETFIPGGVTQMYSP